MVLVATDEERAGAAMAALVGLAGERGLRMTRAKAIHLLYLADVESIAAGGKSGSGILWRWLRYGPYCHCLRAVEERLAADGVIECSAGDAAGSAGEAVLSASRSCGDIGSGSGGFVRHIDAALERHGHRSDGALSDAVNGTAPMLEAQRRGERGVLLDMREAGSAHADVVMDMLAERPDLAVPPHIDPEHLGSPDAEEIVGVLRSNRARATRKLLAH